MLIITPSHIPRLHFPISEPFRTTHGRLLGDQPVTLLSRQSNIKTWGNGNAVISLNFLSCTVYNPSCLYIIHNVGIDACTCNTVVIQPRVGKRNLNKPEPLTRINVDLVMLNPTCFSLTCPASLPSGRNVDTMMLKHLPLPLPFPALVSPPDRLSPPFTPLC